ncbi:hypothetical protein GCM10023231_41520 [Olivibacter ginsenosidimutans]|uniref:HTH araC/xylS-type domain-containing protein n=2 Tax=Olivibacter ginsenosidimutans TaxID=1176537 RepID=A0ABP9CBN0_9SPHI
MSEMLLPDDCFAFFLVIKGTGQFGTDESVIKLLPDHLYIVATDPIQRLFGFSEDFQSYVILFRKTFLTNTFINEPLVENLIHYDFGKPEIFELNKGNYMEIYQLFDRLYREYHNHKLFHEKMLTLQFVELLFEIARINEPLSANTPIFPTRQQQLVNKFKLLVNEFFLVKRTVKQYADNLFVTAKYLGEVVKECTGLTALHIIHARIFQEAQHWLLHTNLSIKEIAEKLKFDTSAHFSRFFKHFSGYNPSEFQRNALIME